MCLIFGNHTQEDIILRKELELLAEANENFDVVHVLSGLSEEETPPDGGYKGYVSSDIIIKHFPEPSADSLVYVCGPPPMMKAVCGDKNPDKSQGELVGILKDLGYGADSVYKF